MEKVVKLEVSEQEFRLMLGALAELPFKTSASLLEKLQKQYMAKQVMPKPAQVVPES